MVNQMIDELINQRPTRFGIYRTVLSDNPLSDPRPKQRLRIYDDYVIERSRQARKVAPPTSDEES